MAENTKIQWATHTFNPWRGCTKVAAGCANCYADSQAKRNPGVLGIWGDHGTRVVASESMWRQPVKWDKDAETTAEVWPEDRPRVFCASMCDVFEAIGSDHVVDAKGQPIYRPFGDIKKPIGAEDHYRIGLHHLRSRLFDLIDATPNLDWLLLTKRPENVRRMWCSHANTDGQPPSQLRRANVWLGTSVAAQADADRNIPELLKCRDLCAKLFVSVEPLVGPVDLRAIGAFGEPCKLCIDQSHDAETNVVECRKCDGTGYVTSGVDWAIVGGESGANARQCKVEWVRSIVKQCHDADVACFVKQLGSNSDCAVSGAVHAAMGVGVECEHGYDVRPKCDGQRQDKLWDKKGGNPAEWPKDLRIREFPR